MGRLVKALGAGIGLASEAYTAHKSPSPSPGSSRAPPATQASSSTPAPPQYREGDDYSDSDEEVNKRAQDDETIWELDAAQPPAYSQEAPSHDEVDQLVQNFNLQHPLLPGTRPIGRLEDPVILPQRRPENRSRGFIRAYAPSLHECGIDQQTFLDFLDSFEKSIEASPYLRIANVAFGIAGLVPGLATMIVSTIGQQAIRVGKEIEGRHKTNTFLEQINESLFKPRGLFAVVMTFKPTSNVPASRLRVSNELVDIGGMMPKLKTSDGVTRDIELPAAAPLIFPALDAIPDGEKQSWMKKSSSFVADYYDRRTQATFAAQNPNAGTLNNALPSPTFTSRYSDPNSTANNGSLMSLVTGGAVNPRARRDARGKGRLRSRREDRQRLGNKNPRGALRKFVKEDVLYLLVTNLPSDAEIASEIAAHPELADGSYGGVDNVNNWH